MQDPALLFTSSTSQDPLTTHFTQKHHRLNQELCELITSYPFISFHTLDIQDKNSLWTLVKSVDKGNGYVYADVDAGKLMRQGVVGGERGG